VPRRAGTQQIGAASGRAYVAGRFSIERMVRRYEAVYQGAIKDRR
jgi:hypothetical protein